MGLDGPFGGSRASAARRRNDRNNCYSRSMATTPGQRLWLSLLRADQYDQQAAAVVPSPTSGRMDPERATQKWLEGMSRHLKASFPEKLRRARETAKLTQEQLAHIADLSVTGLAMIERGERVPGVDTAARICWALDVASGKA
jgi:DNA-binding XRE family transcriptional regulator